MDQIEYRDMHNTKIQIGDEVCCEGEIYEVYQNLFSERLVIDNEEGQCDLSEVYNRCEVVKRED